MTRYTENFLISLFAGALWALIYLVVTGNPLGMPYFIFGMVCSCVALAACDMRKRSSK